MTRIREVVTAATIGAILLISLLQPKLKVENNIELTGNLTFGVSLSLKTVSRTENPEAVDRENISDEEGAAMLLNVQQSRVQIGGLLDQQPTRNSATDINFTYRDRANGESWLTRIREVVMVATHRGNIAH